MSIPVFIQTAEGVDGTPTNPTVATFVNPVGQGNMIVAMIVATEAFNFTSVTDSAGNTYHLAATAIYDASYQLYLYYAFNVIGGAVAVHVNWSTTVTFQLIHAAEYSGASQSSPLDVASGAEGSSALADAGSLTPMQTDGIVIAGFANTNQGLGGNDHGFTVRANYNFGQDVLKDKPSNGPSTPVNTQSACANNPWLAVAAIFYPGVVPPMIEAEW